MCTKSPETTPKGHSRELPERLLHRSLIIAGVIFFVFLFTKRPIYSIMALLGSTIVLLGFTMTIRLTDQYLQKKRGKLLFFLTEIGKIVLIGVGFLWISRYSELGGLAFIVGLSVVILAVLCEGLLYLIRMVFHHGT